MLSASYEGRRMMGRKELGKSVMFVVLGTKTGRIRKWILMFCRSLLVSVKPMSWFIALKKQGLDGMDFF